MDHSADSLVSTLLGLPDERRAAVERELTAVARQAALGSLAPDIAHDIANPLFAIIGLVELLLMDTPPESADRLRLVRETALELKDILADFSALARAEGAEQADLVAATAEAVRLAARGRGKYAALAERYPDGPVPVVCPEPLVVQAALHLLLGARGHERVEVEVTTDGVLRVSPTDPDALGALAAARIASDHGGSLAGGTLTLPLVR
jgi:signal transduction histidine kinase